MDFDLNLLAYCGLYCDQCSCRAAFADQDMRHMAHMPAPYRATRPKPSDNNCGGCKGQSLCPPCAIKACAEAKNIDHCGQCPDFPCDRIGTFRTDGWAHHAEAVENLRRIRENGLAAWFETLRPTLQCHCGKRKSWYCGCPDHP